MNSSSDTTAEFDQADEEILIRQVSDETLEDAGGFAAIPGGCDMTFKTWNCNLSFTC